MLEKNKTLLIVGVFVVLVAIVFFMIQSYQTSKTTQYGLSPNILYLTAPVFSFNGIVNKVGGNSITVTQTFVSGGSGGMNSPMNPQGGVGPYSTPLPTPTPKIIRYTAVINEGTALTQPQSPIPYIIITPPPLAEKKITIADIRPGMQLSINTASDLRSITNDIFTATQITLPQEQRSISGTVESISDNKIVVKSSNDMYLTAGPTRKPPTIYTCAITPHTEISHMMGKPEAVKAGMIIIGMQVTVYVDGDATHGNSFTALRIDPMILATPQPLPSLSPLPTGGVQGI